MRASGYIMKDESGTYKAAWYYQGFVTDHTTDSFFWGKALKKAVDKARPGLTRIVFCSYSESGRDYSPEIAVRGRVRDIKKEIEKLSKGCNRQAHTGMPGIQGYQQMENAATARLVNLDSGKRSMARWIEALYPHTPTAEDVDRALLALMDGNSANDIVRLTGCSPDRATEIYNIFSHLSEKYFG